MRRIGFFCVVLFILGSTIPAFSSGQTVFGPKKLTISAWRIHLSTHRFNAPGPQKGLLTLKNDAGKTVRGGLLLFNNTPIAVNLRDNPVFEREVDLGKNNRLMVFLNGKPKASATLEVRTQEVIPPPQAEFTADPESIRPNQSSTLAWTTQHAEDVSIDQGIGGVALNGSVSVTPPADTTYTLTAQGPGGTVTRTAQVNVVNQPPVAHPQSLTLDQGTSLGITLTGSDPDDDPLTFVTETQPAHGNLTGQAHDLTYTPDPQYHGNDGFTFKVNDGYVDSESAFISLTINQVNQPPVAQDDFAQTDAGQPVSIDVLANDWDPDGDTLSIQSFTQPADGTAAHNGNGIFTYTPHPGFSGTDSFLYVISDGHGGTGQATVTITVTPVQFLISITSPMNNDLISGPATMVQGTISNPLGNETGLIVNGIKALVDGSQFVANHVPLDQGENTITAVATDTQENTSENSISVFAETTESYLAVTANPQTGVSPFEATLAVDMMFNPVDLQVHGTGPGDVEISDGDEYDRFNLLLTAPGIYFITAEAADDQGYVYTDEVAVQVWSETELDALLQFKWDQMKTALMAGDIEESAKYFSSASRSLYQQRFTALLSVLDQVGGDMGQIALVEAEGNRAVYDLITVRDDKIYSYEVVFIRDEEDGIWRIYNF